MVTKIRDALFYIFRDFHLPPISSNFKDYEVKTWKNHSAIKICFNKLFKKVDPPGPETYMSKIIEHLWKGKKGPKMQIAFAISVCELLLNPDNLHVTIKEEVIMLTLIKKFVSF